MSASTTQEHATEYRFGGFVRNHAPFIGSLWCTGCASAETRETGSWIDATSCVSPPGYPEECCDGCHKPIADCTPLEVTGLAIVEHIPCKIF